MQTNGVAAMVTSKTVNAGEISISLQSVRASHRPLPPCQDESFLRPLRRRRFNTERPDAVAILFLKPCTRERFLRFG